MSNNALNSIVADCMEALERVGNLFASDAAAQALLGRLGWQLSALPAPLRALGDRLRELRPLITKARAHSDSPETWIDLARAVAGLVTEIRALKNQSFDNDLDVAHFGSQLAEQLLHWAAIEQLDRRHPGLLAILRAIGIVRSIRHVATDGRPPYVEDRLVAPDFAASLASPATLLRAVWAWGDPAFDGSGLLDELVAAFRMFGLPAGFVLFPPSTRELTEVEPGAMRWHVVARFLSGTTNGVRYEAGLRLLTLRDGTEPAIAIVPYVEGSLAETVKFGDGFELAIAGAVSADEGRALLLAPSRIRLVNALFGTVDTAEETAAVGEISATIRRRQADRVETAIGPVVVQSAGWSIHAAARGTEGTGGELAIEAALTDASVGLPVADDGLLGSLFSGELATIPVPLVLGISSRRGVYIGPTGLSDDVAVSLQLGPVDVRRVSLKVDAVDSGLRASVGTSIAAGVGPVSLAVEGFGASFSIQFPGSGGNLGVADLAIGFKPPSGIGLSVEAAGVLTGGGFLFPGPATGTYAGAMQLSLHDGLTLAAYGLIATKMPDGSRGYSLLIFITAEDFKPVPLGFGFVLRSIGGMVGVHRTFDQEVVKAGLRADTLATLLFPRDPVANAPALIQALAAAFPARQGSYLLGLLARITWFTPTLVQLDLALILELGARTRLLALGRASALLPSRDNDLIRLNLDALGVLDFDAGTLAADAALVDSRLAHQFPITGSAALRARWSGDVEGSFVLAAGGLNPRFAPPTGFPALERVAIALCAGNNPRLVCDGYLAVTANTVQFGARASLYAEAVGFSVAGDLGFDALVTLLPPHFLVDFHAAVQLKRGSDNLFKVTLDGTLEGPLPLRIAAKATFEILWFSFSVHFNFTLAAGGVAQAVGEAVALATELAKALADPASWSTRRAPTLAHGVALRSVPAGAAPVLDPLGQLVVRQQLVPLDAGRDVDTYDGAPVAGPRRFQVAGTLNGQAGTPVSGAFAPARYFVMSDDDKLVAPSFETMGAGLVLGDSAVAFDAATVVPAPLKYEPVTLNPPGDPSDAAPGTPPAPLPYAMPLAALHKQLPSGAAARVPVRRVGRARFRNAAVKPAATLRPPSWRIVQASDGALASVSPSVATWTDYRAALASMNRGGARWLMVPAHELEA